MPKEELKLRETSRKIRRIFELLSQENAFRQVSAADLADLALDLRHAGEWLRMNADHNTSAEMNGAIEDYRKNLGALQKILPDFYGCLLTERARLERDRAHAAVAAEWARASKGTI
jgi:hypothetical protein